MQEQVMNLNVFFSKEKIRLQEIKIKKERLIQYKTGLLRD